MLDVSVVIVSWNTQDILGDCLESVYEQTRGISFETLVVDNASKDGTADMVKARFPQAILIQNAANGGFAAANNQGIAASQGRYVLLLNPDTVVLDNAIAKTLAFADAHPEAGCVGCRILNADRSLQSSCFLFPSLLNLFLSTTYLYKAFPRSRFFGREYMSWWDRNDSREVDVVTGCYMLVRRETLKAAGPMDEDYFMYGEEADWCYRFRKAGWKNLFTPDGSIVHLGGVSTSQVKPQMMLQLRAGLLLFISKHRSRIDYAIACAMVSLFFVVRMPFHFILLLLPREQRGQTWLRIKLYARGTVKAIQGWRALSTRPSDRRPSRSPSRC